MREAMSPELALYLGRQHEFYLGRVSDVTHRSWFSRQTLSVMGVLSAEPPCWWHGYRMAEATGLTSGTLYPILMRLAGQGLVEACWEHEQPADRPRRHLYRLTPDGLARAAVALAGASCTAWAPLASASDSAWAPLADGPPH